MRSIAIINQKGGVGKTTSTLHIGAGLVLLGHRVLVVDLDPQAHLTFALGIELAKGEAGLRQLLLGEAELLQVTRQTFGPEAVAASFDLAGADHEMASLPGRELTLREALRRGGSEDRYDFVLLDCPPNLGLLTVMGLVAARELIVPTQAEYLALHSLARLMATVDLIRQEQNPGLHLTGVLLTRFDPRRRLSREVQARLGQHFGPALLDTAIRENVALAEAPSFAKDVFSYRPRSSGASDYMNLCREIIGRAPR